MSSNQNFKTGVTDISSATEDISIRKQHRNITLIDKDKKTKNETHQLIILEKEDNVRKDIFGNEIKKGGKHKISFIDNPIFLNVNEDEKIEKNYENDGEGIVEIIKVESYKTFNKLNNYEKEIYPCNERVCCESCFLY
jgi:hypothetical protein